MQGRRQPLLLLLLARYPTWSVGAFGRLSL